VKFIQIDRVEYPTADAASVGYSCYSDSGYKSGQTFLFKRENGDWKLYIGPKFP
jgi:hypothetical protein